jgi:hypothetical protein
MVSPQRAPEQQRDIASPVALIPLDVLLLARDHQGVAQHIGLVSFQQEHLLQRLAGRGQVVGGVGLRSSVGQPGQFSRAGDLGEQLRSLGEVSESGLGGVGRRFACQP